MLGLSPSVFWDMTPREFWNAMQGFTDLEESRSQRDWVRARWQTTWIVNCFTSKESMMQPTDLIQFDWEKEPAQEVVIPTVEDFERVKAKYGLK